MRLCFLLPLLFLGCACATVQPAAAPRDTIDLVARVLPAAFEEVSA